MPDTHVNAVPLLRRENLEPVPPLGIFWIAACALLKRRRLNFPYYALEE
jgi:hypothetical protein